MGGALVQVFDQDRLYLNGFDEALDPLARREAKALIKPFFIRHGRQMAFFFPVSGVSVERQRVMGRAQAFGELTHRRVHARGGLGLA